MSTTIEVAHLSKVFSYLLLGQEGNCYTAGVKTFTNEKLEFVDDLIIVGKGPELLKEIQRFSQHYLVDRDAKIYLYAICARTASPKTKGAIYEALSSICPTGEDILTFAYFSEQIGKSKGGGGTGWGRAHRRAISKWYNDQPAKQLAITCTKNASLHGWKHRDLLRLGHVKPTNKGVALVMKYLTKGLEETTKEFEGDGNVSSDVADVLSYLKAVHAIKHCKNDQEAALLISQHGLPLETTPTMLRKSAEVWRTALPVTDLSKILTHLRRFAQLGFLAPNSLVLPIILDQLRDRDKLSGSKLDSVDVLLATKKYEELGRSTTVLGGRSTKRRLTSAVVDALHTLFATSLQYVHATGKRYLIAVDVRNPMVHNKVQGSAHLTAALASALIILQLLHVETNVTCAAFSMNDLKILDLTKDMNLNDITQRMRETPMGPVNCAKPMLWAQQANKPYDVFIILTDNQIKQVDVKPLDALHQYREALNLPQSRLIVCAMAMRRFIVTSSTDDTHVLHIAGFDSRVPRLIRSFAQLTL